MTVHRTRLFLVDASCYIFRAFFAASKIVNSSPARVRASYGFTNTILKLVSRHQPEFLAVVFDGGKKTFRHRQFAGYKSNRPPPPAELIHELPHIKRALAALEVPVLQSAGYEADDVIATACRLFSGAERELVVVSGDKDFMQLVSDRVALLDGATNRWTRVDDVRRKFGVEPGQMVDLIGLIGDRSDNIPGVRGIGPKTATSLIQQFGSLDNLFNRLEDLNAIGSNLRTALEKGRQTALLSRALARFQSDVPLLIRPDELRFSGLTKEKYRRLFAEIQFDRRIPSTANQPSCGS